MMSAKQIVAIALFLTVGIGCEALAPPAKELSAYELDVARAALHLQYAYNGAGDESDNGGDIQCPCGGSGKSGDGLGPCICVANGGRCTCASGSVSAAEVPEGDSVASVPVAGAEAEAEPVVSDVACACPGGCACKGACQCVPEPVEAAQPEPVVEPVTEVAAAEAPVAAETVPVDEQILVEYVMQQLGGRTGVLYFGSEQCVFCPKTKDKYVPWMTSKGWKAAYVDIATCPAIAEICDPDPADQTIPVPFAVCIKNGKLLEIVPAIDDEWTVLAPFGFSRPTDQPTLATAAQPAAATGASHVKLSIDGFKGSGTVIGNRDGKLLVLTAAHLYRDAPVAATIVEIGSEWCRASLLAEDKETDLALFAVDYEADFPVAEIGDAPGNSSAIVTQGYPLGGKYLERRMSVLYGIPTRQGLATAPNKYYATSGFQNGESGGGVFSAGKLIGVIHGTDQGGYGMVVSQPTVVDFLTKQGVL